MFSKFCKHWGLLDELFPDLGELGKKWQPFGAI